MGNKSNRAYPRRKRRFNHLANFQSKSKNIEKSTAMPGNDTTDGPTTVVDVVSVLCPMSAVQDSHELSLDPPSDAQDPLFVQTEISSIRSSDGSVITELEVVPISNEVVMNNEPSRSTAFKNMCRLCLARDGNSWIEIFSDEQYKGVDEITPSNISAIIEQSTSVKISEKDNLPNQLCNQCFQDLRFAYQFREKSMRSQNVLNSMVNATSQSLHEPKKVGVPMKRQVKIVHLKRIRNPLRKSKPNPRIKHPVDSTDNLETEQKNAGDVQCEFCGKVFEKPESLQYHLNRHNDVRPFACTEPFCDKSFHSPMNRKKHIQNVHCIDPRYKCDLCEKAYTKAEKLKFHRSTHFPPTTPCTVCGKLLRSKSTMYKHQASHAERRFKCDDCGKSFQNSYTLNVHRRIHTNEKPFICCRCGETFAHKCLLKAHTDRKHSD